MRRTELSRLADASPDEIAVMVALAAGENVALVCWTHEGCLERVKALFDKLTACGLPAIITLSRKQIRVDPQPHDIHVHGATGVLSWFTDKDILDGYNRGRSFTTIWNHGCSAEAMKSLSLNLPGGGVGRIV